MTITEQTKDRLAALAQLGTSLSSVCTAAIAGADSDDPRVDPLMGTVRKIFFATQSLGSEVSRIGSGSNTVRKNTAALFTAIGVARPDGLADEISLRQFQNAINVASPSTAFEDIVEEFNGV